MSRLASAIYSRVCRSDLSVPGFCLVNLGTSTDSATLRQHMVALAREMSAIHARDVGQSLVILSVLRVDQQNSTKLHLDGAPEESLLMLGYEPSEIESTIEIADYARSAADLGISPREFLERHNPMLPIGQQLIRPYVNSVPCYSTDSYQILIVNNSSAAFDQRSWQGALHAATIPAPDDSKRRIVNSMLMTRAPIGAPHVVSGAELEVFLHASSVRRRSYDRPDLADDE